MIDTSVESFDWILFDADNTLFHFREFEGLKLAFRQWQFDFTQEHYNAYKTLNSQLWRCYEKHEITLPEIAQKRFEHWATQFEITHAELNSAFLAAMAKVCVPFEGAVDLIKQLHSQVKLGIISNGFTELQAVRLEHNNLAHYFDFVLTSEEAGVGKPHVEIFEFAFKHKMNHPNPQKVLMVGDNLHSDIQGGLNAGIKTCWLNTHEIHNPDDIQPHFTVNSHAELSSHLLGHFLQPA